MNKNKKRQVMPLLSNLVTAIMSMSNDADKLEQFDNEQAAIRMKSKFLSIKRSEWTELSDGITSIRKEVRQRPTRILSPETKERLATGLNKKAVNTKNKL